MACIDFSTWNDAVAACANQTQSVRGLGSGYKRTGVAGLRGLGLSVSATISPSSLQNALLMSSGVPLVAPAPPTGYALNVGTAASQTSDPCAIAAMTPCSKPKALTSAPPPIVCGSGFMKSCTPQPCHCAPVPQDTTTMSASSTAGFSQWGLLAVLAVGGFVVYKVATRKKASS